MFYYNSCSRNAWNYDLKSYILFCWVVRMHEITVCKIESYFISCREKDWKHNHFPWKQKVHHTSKNFQVLNIFILNSHSSQLNFYFCFTTLNWNWLLFLSKNSLNVVFKLLLFELSSVLGREDRTLFFEPIQYFLLTSAKTKSTFCTSLLLKTFVVLWSHFIFLFLLRK